MAMMSKGNSEYSILIWAGVVGFLLLYFSSGSNQSGPCSLWSNPPVTPEEKIYNDRISQDPYVQYIRSAVESFLGNHYDQGNYSGLLNGYHYTDSAYKDLSNTDKSYLKSKFIVLQTDEAPGGGKGIVLLFKDKPDKTFYAWVYDYRGPAPGNHNVGYDLRALTPIDLPQGVTIQDLQKQYTNQICDSTIGI